MRERVSILGVPHDDNSSFLKGAALAPARIRLELSSAAGNMWTETGIDLAAPGCMSDQGDIRFSKRRNPWEVIETRVDELIGDGCRVICLGGDHAITHPILRAVRRHYSRLTIVHVDAHPDIYDNFMDNPRSHASPFARILEERLADRLIQLGIRTTTGHQRDQILRFGVEVLEARNFPERPKLNLTTPVYLSIDMDGIDPAFAPGVSHRESGGLTPRQVIQIIQSISQPIAGADIVEFNPKNDINNLTASVAAKLVKEIAGMMILNP